MKSSIFVFVFFILTCQSDAGKMDPWRSEQFVPYIKECLGKLNLLFPIRSSYQITLSKIQACRPQGLTNILSNEEIQNEFEILMNKIEPILKMVCIFRTYQCKTNHQKLDISC